MFFYNFRFELTGFSFWFAVENFTLYLRFNQMQAIASSEIIFIICTSTNKQTH